ncbi:MAG: ComC/BlpC family leader-containing pheromone/bacteriocin [Deltaproteobacteria bacterium]|nr:ComC/BlpC family leader-containing pheromone/bacteriocin [Deltaproteobacteria bacterium]
MKTKQAPTNQFQSIDMDQLNTVTGGCACGCGQVNCNCANGSCGMGAAVGTRQQPSWGR